MLGAKTRHEYPKLKQLMENDILDRYPNMARHIDEIRIEKSSEVPISGDIRNGAVFGQIDSNVTKHEDTRNARMVQSFRTETTDSLKRYIDSAMDSLVSKGVDAEVAKHRVADSIATFVGFDKAKQQYVVMGVPPTKDGKVTDSLLQQTSIPMWNITMFTRVFKQPFVSSQAKRLVSIESSAANPWADVMLFFKESFEGWGKVSSTAKGNVKQNNSNPVSNEASQMAAEIFNLSVDYESDVMEDLKAQAPGNFLTGQLKADRERYAGAVLDRMQDLLIYFGSQEAGIDGLMDVGAVEVYTGTPMWDLYESDTATAGADIVQAFNDLIGNFLRENHYMPTEVKINVSERTYQALTQKMFNKTYNPQAPIQILEGNFKGARGLDGGVINCAYSIVADTMCNANTPFNPTDYDLTFITVPAIKDEFNGTQDSLVIVPELVKNWIVPALRQRTGVILS